MNVCVQIKNVMLSGMLLAVIMTCYDDSKAAFLLRKKTIKGSQESNLAIFKNGLGFVKKPINDNTF